MNLWVVQFLLILGNDFTGCAHTRKTFSGIFKFPSFTHKKSKISACKKVLLAFGKMLSSSLSPPPLPPSICSRPLSLTNVKGFNHKVGKPEMLSCPNDNNTGIPQPFDVQLTIMDVSLNGAYFDILLDFCVPQRDEKTPYLDVLVYGNLGF